MLLRGRLLVRRFAKFVALSNTDRRMVVQAFLALGAVDLGLRTRGFQALVEQAQTAGESATRAVLPNDLTRAHQYARWLDVASRFHIVSAHCLHRSLALHRWLLNEGLPSDLRIGVRKENNELKAHAWVELDGQILNDPPNAVAGFTPLANAGGQLPTWVRAKAAPDRDLTDAIGGGAFSWR